MPLSDPKDDITEDSHARGRVIVISEAPISDPDDRTVVTYDFDGSPGALTGVSIASSRAIEIPALLSHLQSIWDKEKCRARDGRAGREME